MDLALPGHRRRPLQGEKALHEVNADRGCTYSPAGAAELALPGRQRRPLQGERGLHEVSPNRGVPRFRHAQAFGRHILLPVNLKRHGVGGFDLFLLLNGRFSQCGKARELVGCERLGPQRSLRFQRMVTSDSATQTGRAVVTS